LLSVLLMMRHRLLVVCLLLTGCDLYLGGDDTGDDVCNVDYGGGGGGPDYQYRDPTTAQCSSFGGGGCDCYGCADTAPIPDWGSCQSVCSELTESDCATTPGCYSAWLVGGDTTMYWDCFQTAPSGPVAGSCDGLDAYACSRHDNCRAYYSSNAGSTKFDFCSDEPDPTCTLACDAGFVCKHECHGSTCGPACVSVLTCQSIICDPGTCAETCTVDSTGKTTCAPQCVPTGPACATLTTENACVMRTDCVPVYAGQDCTCYPDHCECQILTYERCETR
jgi:hypothetical protein